MARHRFEESDSFHWSTGVRTKDDRGLSDLDMALESQVKAFAVSSQRHLWVAWVVIGAGLLIYGPGML